MVKEAIRLGDIRGILLRGSKKQQTNFKYIDDKILSIKRQNNNIQNAINLLELFLHINGLELNCMDKSITY
jgi:hypothetical protein